MHISNSITHYFRSFADLIDNVAGRYKKPPCDANGKVLSKPFGASLNARFQQIPPFLMRICGMWHPRSVPYPLRALRATIYIFGIFEYVSSYLLSDSGLPTAQLLGVNYAFSFANIVDAVTLGEVNETLASNSEMPEELPAFFVVTCVNGFVLLLYHAQLVSMFFGLLQHQLDDNPFTEQQHFFSGEDEKGDTVNNVRYQTQVEPAAAEIAAEGPENPRIRRFHGNSTTSITGSCDDGPFLMCTRTKSKELGSN